jgi:DNA-binding transcriptional ArsR family regulator
MDTVGAVFGALADPTRRQMLETLMRDGSTSVPALTAELPMTRQAIAKHLAVLDGAGLIQRQRQRGGGREVTYQLRPQALAPAAAWMNAADAAWSGRLDRLKAAVENS